MKKYASSYQEKQITILIVHKDMIKKPKEDLLNILDSIEN